MIKEEAEEASPLLSKCVSCSSLISNRYRYDMSWRCCACLWQLSFSVICSIV